MKKSELAPRNKFSFKSRKPTGIGKNLANPVQESKGNEENKEGIQNKESNGASESDTAKTSNNENFQTITISDHYNTCISINSYLTSSSENKVLDFQISNLDHCIVNLVNSTVTIGAIHIKELKNTVIMSGPVGGSILIYDCEGCLFLVGCHQVHIFILYCEQTKVGTKFDEKVELYLM